MQPLLEGCLVRVGPRGMVPVALVVERDAQLLGRVQLDASPSIVLDGHLSKDVVNPYTDYRFDGGDGQVAPARLTVVVVPSGAPRAVTVQPRFRASWASTLSKRRALGV